MALPPITITTVNRGHPMTTPSYRKGDYELAKRVGLTPPRVPFNREAITGEMTIKSPSKQARQAAYLSKQYTRGAHRSIDAPLTMAATLNLNDAETLALIRAVGDELGATLETGEYPEWIVDGAVNAAMLKLSQGDSK